MKQQGVYVAFKMIDVKTLKSWLDTEMAVLVDVREAVERAEASIPGSLFVPLGNLKRQNLPDLAGKKLVMHCRGGGRGGRACEKLLAEDENLEIYNLEGGITAWGEAGFAVESSAKKILPLGRQVQVTIGGMLLLFCALGYLIAPIFFLLTAVIGLGLVFAGITGFCGLAILLAKMPWNRSGASKSFCQIKPSK
jgi:rhodanese-related sulfurtransferase